MNAPTNGNGTKPLDPQTEREIDSVLEQHKTNKPGKGNPPCGTPKSPKTEEKTEKQPKAGAIAKASEALDTKLAEAASTVVEADKKQQQALVAMGYREGLQDSKTIAKGHQLGLMKGLSELKALNTHSLSQQLGILRQHTDAINAEDVAESLESFVGDADSLSSLDNLLSELEELTGLDAEGKEGLKLLGKG